MRRKSRLLNTDVVGIAATTRRVPDALRHLLIGSLSVLASCAPTPEEDDPEQSPDERVECVRATSELSLPAPEHPFVGLITNLEFRRDGRFASAVEEDAALWFAERAVSVALVPTNKATLHEVERYRPAAGGKASKGTCFEFVEFDAAVDLTLDAAALRISETVVRLTAGQPGTRVTVLVNDEQLDQLVPERGADSPKIRLEITLRADPTSAVAEHIKVLGVYPDGRIVELAAASIE